MRREKIKKKFQMKMSRRQVLKAGLFAGAGMMVPWRFIPAVQAQSLLPGVLSDPAGQPKFVNPCPDALAPGFKILTPKSNDTKIKVFAGPSSQWTGLMNGNSQVYTDIWGYGRSNWNNGIPTWPGPTIEAKSKRKVEVRWENDLGFSHLLPVDTSLHWAYSLPGYTANTIEADGVPMVTHLHGGHSDFQYDGNPEFFFSPGFTVKGPRFVDKTYIYDNDQPAGNLWYHDHALGITRLNVYAGLAGFYFIRDNFDTGDDKNKLGLPAWPFEKAYAIQDRMFTINGQLFYPAWPGDPFYDEFIPPGYTGPNPTALAEFFGDHMVVNGMIWPKEDVQPRNYRMHLLNGTDSRFMVIQFVAVNAEVTDPNDGSAGDPISFFVIGSDQGLASAATPTDTLLSEPGSRYDIIFDFKDLQGKRIIMKNIGGDAPFNGEAAEDFFTDRQTDRIMAFDVADISNIYDSFDPTAIDNYGGNTKAVNRVRKVALFEGMDEYGRLQPLLGTAEPATDYQGNPIYWPETQPYIDAGLAYLDDGVTRRPMEGSIAWHSPTTENPALGSTEIWEIYNATGDAHPVHLHLVNFEVLDRKTFTADVVEQAVVQHNGDLGSGFRLENISVNGGPLNPGNEYVENAPKDMVTALPDQVTRIKVTFDKPGRYVWHCHILSHEDHEMMRVLHVGPGA